MGAALCLPFLGRPLVSLACAYVRTAVLVLFSRVWCANARPSIGCMSVRARVCRDTGRCYEPADAWLQLRQVREPRDLRSAPARTLRARAQYRLQRLLEMTWKSSR